MGASAALAHSQNFASFNGRLALWLTFFGLSGLVVVTIPSRTRKHQARLLCAVLLLLATTGVTWFACGSNGTPPSRDGGTPPGTYNLSVTGTFTSSSTTLTHSAQLTLVVN